MTLNITKPLRSMTAAELAQTREERLPLHCQTMQRRSRVYPTSYVYSDIEELTKETLDATVADMLRQGWQRSGVYFVRTAK